MADDQPRRVFIAGSTGATGRTLVRLADRRDLDIKPHVRPSTAAKGEVHPAAAVLDLSDIDALTEALRDVTTVIQLIGTMRRRFASGDTYETSDIGTTRHLVRAASNAEVDHIILLSSVGAGQPVGAYLKAKAEAEALIRDSGVPYTIVRPSAFDGEGHRPPPGMRSLTRWLNLRKYEPISMTDLAGSILYLAENRHALGDVLEGDALWRIVDAARISGAIPTQLPSPAR